MVSVTYKGRFLAVEVKGVGVVERDTPTDVDDAMAEQLLAQGWQRSRKPKDENKRDGK